MTNTYLLKNKIKASRHTYCYVAECLGITRFGLSKKINNKTEFKPSEITTLCDLLGIKNLKERDVIFFTVKVELKSINART